MSALTSLGDYLDSWATTDETKDVVHTILALASAGTVISKLISQGPLAGSMADVVAHNSDGDAQKELDRLTNVQVLEALNSAPVAYIASEELDDAVATGNEDAPLCVAIDPLDGSSNINTNISVGTIFSILPRRDDATAIAREHFFQKGVSQLAAGYIIYGPNTAMVLSVGEGTHIFTLNPQTGQFEQTAANVQIPAATREFAINASNYRHWDEGIRGYVDECLEGSQGAREKDFNMRWVASMVAECHRILIRGGIYLYPGDARQGYTDGRLRLIYEGNPIAFLIEQAGGRATTGYTRILDLEPTDIHQRIPLIFGSAEEVETVERCLRDTESSAERSPLFGQRGLFRT
jgi:fructose-1,6-bisphosphatase I